MIKCKICKELRLLYVEKGNICYKCAKIEDAIAKDLVRFLNRLVRKINPDTTLTERKKWIINEVVFHKYMTVKQARQFCKEMKR